jgi:hypothetical protein
MIIYIRYKNINSAINHYHYCLFNNELDNFNCPDAAELLIDKIDGVLIDHCQYGNEEDFVTQKLEMNFPHHYSEPGNKMQQTQKAFENESIYSIFDDPISCCRKFETKRFHELKKHYEKDPYLLNLKYITKDLVSVMEGDIESHEYMIKIINDALHSNRPAGSIFNLIIE